MTGSKWRIIPLHLGFGKRVHGTPNTPFHDRFFSSPGKWTDTKNRTTNTENNQYTLPKIHMHPKTDMGVSKNSGIPKWMVKILENP